MRCIYCNTELKQGAKFCPNCGKEVIEFNQCVKCGEQIKAGALFCPHCGAKQQIEEDVVSEMIPQEEMTDPRNDEKAVIHEQSIIKEIGEPQEGNEAHVIQDENIPISESPKDDLANTLEPYKSGQSSKKWLWILCVILLFGIIGGVWFFLNDNQAPEVGTLTAYYAKEDFSANEHEYKKGELICDSNDPLNHVSDEDENNYRYSGDEGGEEYSWLLPKSKVEKKVYTMNQLTPSVIDRQAFFEAENGCVAKIFWSNINGHRFYNWNGKEEKYNEEEIYKECFVLSAELLSPWDNSKYLFEEQLNEKSGYIELYCENKYRQFDHPIGFIEESWCNREGYDFKKSAYDKDGKLLVDQWEIDGIPDYISIAYIADEDALYINGILYYLREESLEASDSEITTTEPVFSIADILGTNGKISLLVKSHGFKEQTYISGRGAECHYYYKNCVIEDDSPVPVDKNTAVCIDCTYGIDGEETIIEVYNYNAYKQLVDEVIKLSKGKNGDDYILQWANNQNISVRLYDKGEEYGGSIIIIEPQ